MDEDAVAMIDIVSLTHARAVAMNRPTPTYGSVWYATVPVSTKVKGRRFVGRSRLPEIWARVGLGDGPAPERQPQARGARGRWTSATASKDD